MATEPTQTTKRRLGIMPVADCFGERHVARLLPPEHKILASKPDSSLGLTDYLIEGPMLPKASIEAPPKVWMRLTMTTPDDTGRIQITGEWDPYTGAVGSWTVGEWSSPNAWRQDMEALDAQ